MMRRTNRIWAALACGAAVMVSGVMAQEGGAPPPAARKSAGGAPLPEHKQNIELVRSLDARGTYIHRVGDALFLTPGNLKEEATGAGALFRLAADPAAPELTSRTLPSAWDVVVTGTYALTCDYRKFMDVWEMREREWRPVARLDLPSMAENIVLRGNLAYIANHNAGLTIVDVSTPAKPVIMGRLDTRIDCDALALWNNTAILYAHHQCRVEVADIRDPANPRKRGECQFELKTFNGGELEVENGIAYVTTNKGVHIVDITDAANPKPVATVDLGVVAVDVMVTDGYLFVANAARGVRVFDVKKPATPVEVGVYQSGDLVASAVAIMRAPQSGMIAESAAEGVEYYAYTANRKGPAMVLRFRAPDRREGRA